MRLASLRSAPPPAPDSTRYSPAGGANYSACERRPSAVREALNSPDVRVDAVALALAPGVGPRKYHERTKGFGSAAHAFGATIAASSQSRLRDEAVRVMADGARRGARLVLIGDPDYPAPLLDLGDPPPFLFVLGNLERITHPAVAIVGTRRATAYGE